MASDKSFSHIAVNSGDDDVVIHAGAPAEPDNDEFGTVNLGDPLALDPDQAGYQAPEGEGDASDEAQAPEAEAPAAPKTTAPKDAYRETTLEDIQGSKMGTTQKVVIVVALLLIVAAVIWATMFAS